MSGAVSIEVLRANAPAVLLGVLILVAGTVSCGLFALRPRPRDSALFYFAISAGMYGLRLIATTTLVRLALPGTDAAWDWIIWVVNYTIFIPFTFFFINTVAPQWKRARAWIVGVALAAAVFGLGTRFLGADAAADTTYSIEVVLYLPLLALMLFVPRRPADRHLWVIRAGFLIACISGVYTNLVGLHVLAGRRDLEALGFLVFLCCQGYIAADRTFRNEHRLVAIGKELEIARSIQFGLLPSQEFAVPGLEIAANALDPAGRR